MNSDEPLEFEELLAPVTDIGDSDILASWRWLVGPDAQPLLLTAFGDLFVEQPTGEVLFLDTYEGSLKPAGESRDAWKRALEGPENIDAWFTPGLLAALQDKGLRLQPGQTYSPIQAPVLGGSMEPDNFECVPWRVHFILMGQLHEQVKDLPAGTPIAGVDIEWDRPRPWWKFW